MHCFLRLPARLDHRRRTLAVFRYRAICHLSIQLADRSLYPRLRHYRPRRDRAAHGLHQQGHLRGIRKGLISPGGPRRRNHRPIASHCYDHTVHNPVGEGERLAINSRWRLTTTRFEELRALRRQLAVHPAATARRKQKFPTMKVSALGSHWTRRWRELDSNPRSPALTRIFRNAGTDPTRRRGAETFAWNR